MCQIINIIPEQHDAHVGLEQLLSQRLESALAGAVSDQDIDAVFDEELKRSSNIVCPS